MAKREGHVGRSGGRTLVPLPVKNGSGEADSVGKRPCCKVIGRLSLWAKHGMHVCQEGSGNVGLVLVFVSFWGFCNPYCSQIRWGFSLPLGQPLLLALSQKKHTLPQHRN